VTSDLIGELRHSTPAWAGSIGGRTNVWTEPGGNNRGAVVLPYHSAVVDVWQWKTTANKLLDDNHLLAATSFRGCGSVVVARCRNDEGRDMTGMTSPSMD